MEFNRADFPPSKGWTKTCALANRQPSSAYKRKKVELNLAEVNAIFDAWDKCRAYLAGKEGT